MPEKVTWNKVGLPDSNLHSAAFKSNGLLFTSGNVGKDKNGHVPENAIDQTILTIENLEKVLISSGTSLDNVVKVLLFISDPADSQAINEIYMKYFTNKPARSCVVLKFPDPRIKVELECIAECPDKKLQANL